MMNTYMKNMKVIFWALVSTCMGMQSIQATETSSMSDQASVGFYKYPFGKYKITALSDGTLPLSASIFSHNVSEEERQQLFNRLTIHSDALATSVNAFLIDDGQSVMLVDSGGASCFGQTLGATAKNIELAGYKLTSIKTVFLTHLHPDHVCGISKEGKAIFPYATVYVHENEANYWLNPNTVNSLPGDKQQKFKDTVTKIEQAIEPYKRTLSFKTFKDGSIINDVEVISSAGHTPGHHSFKLVDANKQLIFLGDVVHSSTLQFEQPKLAVDFDVDPVQAADTRIKLFAKYAKPNITIVAPHLPFPGIGQIQTIDGLKYKWVATPVTPTGSVTTQIKTVVLDPNHVEKIEIKNVDNPINSKINDILEQDKNNIVLEENSLVYKDESSSQVVEQGTHLDPSKIEKFVVGQPQSEKEDVKTVSTNATSTVIQATPIQRSVAPVIQAQPIK